MALASEREKRDVLEKWHKLLTPGEERLKILEGKEPLKEPRLRDFRGLYAKLKSETITSRFPFAKSFEPSAPQDEAIEALHEIRNDFIHYRPGIKIMDSLQYPKIVLHSLTVLEYLVYESESIIWRKDFKQQADELISVIKVQAERLDRKAQHFLQSVKRSNGLE